MKKGVATAISISNGSNEEISKVATLQTSLMSFRPAILNNSGTSLPKITITTSSKVPVLQCSQAQRIDSQSLSHGRITVKGGILHFIR